MTTLLASWVGLRSRVLLGAACIALVALAGIICYDVVCRYLLRAPSRWGYEVSAYLMAVVVLFGAAHTLSLGAHIRVDIVYEQLTGRRRAIADAVAWLAAAVFCAALTWLSAALTLRSFHNGARSMDLALPLAIPQSLVTVGVFAVFVEALILLVTAVRRARRHS